MKKQQVKPLLSISKETHQTGVNKSIKIYGNKRSFSKYVEQLIQKDNE